MNSQSAPTGPKPRPVLRKIVVDLAIMTVIGVVLAFIGPFGSFAEPLSFRLASWVSFAWLGYAIYSPMGFLVDRAEQALDLPRPGLWIAAVALATFPMAAIVWVLGFLPNPVPMPNLNQAMAQYFYVFVVGGGVTALFVLLESQRGKAIDPVAVPPQEPASKASEPVPSNPLLDQLPPALGSEVIALEMEDHYVRVHTALGSELVLMRLRDAMTHVAHIEGRQVHRSWWVARLAVEDVKREGRNVRLVLAGDLEAPVARAQVSEIKDAGWI